MTFTKTIFIALCLVLISNCKYDSEYNGIEGQWLYDYSDMTLYFCDTAIYARENDLAIEFLEILENNMYYTYFTFTNGVLSIENEYDTVVYSYTTMNGSLITDNGIVIKYFPDYNKLTLSFDENNFLKFSGAKYDKSDSIKSYTIEMFLDRYPSTVEY